MYTQMVALSYEFSSFGTIYLRRYYLIAFGVILFDWFGWYYLASSTPLYYLIGLDGTICDDWLGVEIPPRIFCARDTTSFYKQKTPPLPFGLDTGGRYDRIDPPLTNGVDMTPSWTKHYSCGKDFTDDLEIEYRGLGWYINVSYNISYAVVTQTPSGWLRVDVYGHDPRPLMAQLLSLPNRVDMPVYPV